MVDSCQYSDISSDVLDHGVHQSINALNRTAPSELNCVYSKSDRETLDILIFQSRRGGQVLREDLPHRV